MTEVDKREIKGITIGFFRWAIAQTITIVVLLTGSYFNIKSDISDLKIRKEEEARYLELKFQQQQTQASFFQKQIDDINRKLDNISINKN